MVVVLTAVIMAVSVYAFNVCGVRIAAALLDGYTLSLVEPQRALRSLEAANRMPFDFDPSAVSQEYSAFAEMLPLTDEKWRRGISVEHVLENALERQLGAISEVPNDPREYDWVARLYLHSRV